MNSQTIGAGHHRRYCDMLDEEQIRTLANFNVLPTEIVDQIIGHIPVPDIATRNALASTSWHNHDIVADWVVRRLLSDVKDNGNDLRFKDLRFIAREQTSEQKNLFAEALMYAVPGKEADKFDELMQKFDTFLTKDSPYSRCKYTSYAVPPEQRHIIKVNPSIAEQNKDRIKFILDNLHVLNEKTKQRAYEYMRNDQSFHSKTLNIYLDSRKLLCFSPDEKIKLKDLRKLENTLKIMSFETSEGTDESFIERIYDDEETAYYIRHLEKGIFTSLINGIIKMEESSNRKDVRYLEKVHVPALCNLVANISCVDSRNEMRISFKQREKIRKNFYKLLFSLKNNKSDLCSKKRFLHLNNYNTRMYMMYEAIKHLPVEEQENWKFVTKYESKRPLSLLFSHLLQAIKDFTVPRTRPS